MMAWRFLVHWTGCDYGAAYGHFEPYDFLSGVAGLSLLGILYGQIRKHNCHEPRCWRMGRFPVEGQPWTACLRHHPAPPQRGHMRERYHLFIGSKPGRG